MKTVNQVLQTTDYSMFKFLKGNRNVNRPHLVRLRHSFEKKYLFSPIVVNEKYEIIDGQHRFITAKELGYPINFVVVNGYSLKEVQMLNTNMANWGQLDYLNAYCDLGYPDYLKLREFMNAYPDFGIRSAQAILTQKSFTDKNKRDKSIKNKEGVYTHKYFQDGEFKAGDYDLAVDIAEKLLQFKPYYDGFSRSGFVFAFIGIVKIQDYDHAQMITRVAANPRSVVHCNNVGQYKEMLEEIYNYRSRGVKLSFKYAA